MKWNNRLKSILTRAIKSEIPGECLETELRKTAINPEKLVSAAFRSSELRHFAKNQSIADEIDKPARLVSAVIRSSHYRHSFKNNDELSEIKSGKIHEILNGFIEVGCTFDVSGDDFQVIDKNQTLKASDREFTKLNSAVILCQLQQSLLIKHLFSHSPERLEDFAFEIQERESIMTENAKTTLQNYNEAVVGTTRAWFDELLSETKSS